MAFALMNGRSTVPTQAPGREDPCGWGPAFTRRLRKMLILGFFAVVFGRVIALNCGVSLEKAGFDQDLVVPLKTKVLWLDALLLRQQWTLFTDISPFNYTMHFEVTLKDGSTVPLEDSAPQNATGWKGLLFHSEAKIRNNVYGSPTGQRRYLEYLIRQNGIDPAQVSQRVIFIRYTLVLKRQEAELAETHFAPELRHDLDRY